MFSSQCWRILLFSSMGNLVPPVCTLWALIGMGNAVIMRGPGGSVVVLVVGGQAIFLVDWG